MERAGWHQRALSVLLMVTLSTAQLTSSACSVLTSTYTVSSASQATSLGQCEVWFGDIEIRNSGVQTTTYDFTGLQEVDGSVTFENLNGIITSQSPLQILDIFTKNGSHGDFATNISISSTNVYSETDYNPSDTSHFILDNIQTAIDSRLFISNSSRTVANFNMYDGDTVDFLGNPKLLTIKLSGSIASNTTILENGFAYTQSPGVSVDLSNMTSINAINIQGAYKVWLDPLTTIGSDFTITNSPMSDFGSNDLTSVLGSLVISNNSQLQYLGLPKLTFVHDDLRVFDNSMLNNTSEYSYGTGVVSIFQLPSLSSVGGDMQVAGVFDGFTFKSLKSVTGNINITTPKAMSCQAVAEGYANLTSKYFSCQSRNDSLTLKGGVSTSPVTVVAEPETIRDPGLSSGGKAGIGVGVVLGVLALIAAAYLIWRKRNSRQSARSGFAWSGRNTKTDDSPVYEKAELGPGNPRYELGEDGSQYVVQGKQELPAKHGHSEVDQKSVDGVVYEAPGDEFWPAHEKDNDRKSVRTLKTSPADLQHRSSVKATPELSSPDTPADSSTTARSSSAISPISDARSSRLPGGVSPMASPMTRPSQLFPTPEERPVSAVSVDDAQPNSTPKLGDQGGVSPAAEERITLLAGPDHARS